MRSALDHLAWQLVILDGGEPSEHTQFPIHDSPTNAKGNPRVITIQPQIRSQAIRDALAKVQPYKEAEYGHAPTDSILWVLQYLNNWDKHRLLLVMVHSINLEAPGWWSLPEGIESPAWWYNLKPLNSGDPVARFDFHGQTAPASFDPNVSLVVSLDHGPAGHWLRLSSATDDLKNILIGVLREIDWTFRPLFPDEPWLFDGFWDYSA